MRKRRYGEWDPEKSAKSKNGSSVKSLEDTTLTTYHILQRTMTCIQVTSASILDGTHMLAQEKRVHHFAYDFL